MLLLVVLMMGVIVVIDWDGSEGRSRGDKVDEEQSEKRGAHQGSVSHL